MLTPKIERKINTLADDLEDVINRATLLKSTLEDLIFLCHRSEEKIEELEERIKELEEENEKLKASRITKSPPVPPSRKP